MSSFPISSAHEYESRRDIPCEDVRAVEIDRISVDVDVIDDFVGVALHRGTDDRGEGIAAHLDPYVAYEVSQALRFAFERWWDAYSLRAMEASAR